MPKKRSALQSAVGKLISAIQKEWGEESGITSAADHTFDVMDSVHDLLKAETAAAATVLMNGLSLRQYLGEIWVRSHPQVHHAIEQVELLLEESPTGK